ncbi:OadG family protein [Gracilimonas mengyeensis]|uniref:Na+-transporting methylmalonyl-CoA/oxaloacetate decarboxylase, gamma subunit n=1 Tax=Gracilimonas mengyeensis TaxID=1302730 RepID=A0A521D678_9BACT|nr:OadG family protein [Gracilimonas mengyeensis]SMO67194.1 Na+-transporting methylmalonyl-CoA/oxaloacetate decarboxylase, gamma subunit [Gracilimonas mengyeensis]
MFFDRLTELDFSLVTTEEIFIMIEGYAVVFVVLSLLYLVFHNMPKFIDLGKSLKKKLQSRKQSIVEAAEKRMGKNGNGAAKEQDQAVPEISGEVNAAIGAAIHMFANEHHDEESTVLTIEEVSRRYSPWSSKIYSVTNLRR